MSLIRQLLLVVTLVAVSGCASSRFNEADFAKTLPSADQIASTQVAQREYRIGPLDKVSVQVYQMKDLSLEKVQVDASGQLVMPLIGAVQAQGKTVGELSTEIASKLGECCLQRPQVIVQVDDAVSQQVTVTGAVVESNVYLLRGRTTLLEAISMAKGPDQRTANLKRVAVYRMANGQRVGALFNLEDIRGGRAPDPEILGGDTIIVDSSASKSVWRELVQAVPFFSVFTAF